MPNLSDKASNCNNNFTYTSILLNEAVMLLEAVIKEWVPCSVFVSSVLLSLFLFFFFAWGNT